MRSIFFLGAATLALSPAVAMANADPAPVSDAAPDAEGADDQSASAPADASRQIVVTATPFEHTLDDTPAIVARVDADQIRKTGGASLADALRDVPGISATGFASGASRPVIRGMEGTRVRLLEDGTSISDVSDIGPDHGTPIDPLAARSIEVVRGAGTLRYGSQAIGGVVNALNDRVPTHRFSEPFSAEATGSYTSVANTWEGSGLANVQVGNLALHADGFYRGTGDYDTPLGVQQNSFFRGHGESGGATYFFGNDSRIGAAVTQYNAQYGIPSDDTYIDMKQTKVITRSSFGLGTGLFKALNVDGSYADYQHSEREPDGTIVTTFKNKEYNARAELLLNALGFVRNSALGFEYQHRDFSAFGEDSAYLFPASSENVAGYLFTEMQLADRFHIEASGRVESVRLTGTPASDVFTRRSFTPVSGAIGALYSVNDAVKLGLTFSSTGRAPAMTEMFARGGHDGPNTFETGDPTLKIERANSLEASLRIRSGRFRFDGSLYSSWFKNYIYGDLTGRLCDEDGVCSDTATDGLKELFYRQQGAHFRGVEAQANFDLVKTEHGVFTAKVLGDYTRATLDSGSNVPRIPPYRVGGGLAWEGDRLDAGLTLTHYGRQDKFGDFDTATDGYNALSAQVAWRPFKTYPGVEFAVIGQNLTDDVQRLATSLNKDLVVQPGRSVRFVVKMATF